VPAPAQDHALQGGVPRATDERHEVLGDERCRLDCQRAQIDVGRDANAGEDRLEDP
jgi:hypothetical protein